MACEQGRSTQRWAMKTKITRSSGNVFSDLGFGAEELGLTAARDLRAQETRNLLTTLRLCSVETPLAHPLFSIGYGAGSFISFGGPKAHGHSGQALFAKCANKDGAPGRKRPSSPWLRAWA